MATLGELLQNTDPETLKKLGFLRDELPKEATPTGLERFNAKYPGYESTPPAPPPVAPPAPVPPTMVQQTPDISAKLAANDATAKAAPVTELGEVERNALSKASTGGKSPMLSNGGY